MLRPAGGIAQVRSALEKSATDNLTVIVVCFSNDPPPFRGNNLNRVLSKPCLEVISQALADADKDNPRQSFHRSSSDFAMRVGSASATAATSLSSADGSLANARNPSATSTARPLVNPREKLGSSSLLG